jgi:hypothetical protein
MDSAMTTTLGPTAPMVGIVSGQPTAEDDRNDRQDFGMASLAPGVQTRKHSCESGSSMPFIHEVVADTTSQGNLLRLSCPVFPGLF